MNMDRVKKAIPPHPPMGRRSVIRQRRDVAEIVVDCVLKRRPFGEIAKRCNVDLSSLDRFRKNFITPQVEKIVLAENQLAEHDDLDATINAGQDDVQKGLNSIIREQREIYKMMKDKIGDGRDVEDLAPALGQLLRDQGQSFDRLLKSYTALKEKTTIVLSINESPEWAKLQEVLYAVFVDHPEAFEAFRALSQQKKLRLE